MYRPRNQAGSRRQLAALLLGLALILVIPAATRADTDSSLEKAWWKVLQAPKLTVTEIRPALADFIQARTTSNISRSETGLYAMALVELAKRPEIPVPVKVDLLTTACQTAPWLPEPPTSLCRILFAHGNYLESFNYFWQASRNFLTKQSHRHYLRAIFWLGATFLSLGLLALVTLLLAVKYFKAATELVRFRLSKTGHIILLGCGLLAAGALVAMVPSPLPGLLLLAFMLSLLAVRKDKLMLVVILAVTLVVPYAYEQGMLALLVQGTPSLDFTKVPAAGRKPETPARNNRIGHLTPRTLELYSRAESARLLGDYQLATESLEKIVDARVRLAVIYNNLGNLYLLRNKPEKSIRMYLKAIKLDSSTGTPYFNLSQAYLRSSFNLEKSARALAQALKKSPKLNREIDNPEVGQQNIMNLIFMPLPYDFYNRYACSQLETRSIKASFLGKLLFPGAVPLSYYIFVLITLGAILILIWEDPDDQQLCLTCGRIFRLPRARRRQKLCSSCRPGLLGQWPNPKRMHTHLDLLTTVGALLPGFYPFMTNRRTLAICFFVPLLIWIYDLLLCKTGIMTPLPLSTNWVRLFPPVLIWGFSLILTVRLRYRDSPENITRRRS